jgi:hypothetical protein
VAIPKEYHHIITGFYNSKPLFTGGKTVREWLATRSFSEQYDFGIEKLADILGY